MQLIIDLSSGSVRLGEQEDMGRFSVLVLPSGPEDLLDSGALGAVAAALSVHDAGTVDPEGHAFVPPDAVRRLARLASGEEGDELGPEWESRFAAMLDRGSAQGWIADDGSIRAHIEWERR